MQPNSHRIFVCLFTIPPFEEYRETKASEMAFLKSQRKIRTQTGFKFADQRLITESTYRGRTYKRRHIHEVTYT